jgi:hypothetical protein
MWLGSEQDKEDYAQIWNGGQYNWSVDEIIEKNKAHIRALYRVDEWTEEGWKRFTFWLNKTLSMIHMEDAEIIDVPLRAEDPSGAVKDEMAWAGIENVNFQVSRSEGKNVGTSG